MMVDLLRSHGLYFDGSLKIFAENNGCLCLSLLLLFILFCLLLFIGLKLEIFVFRNVFIRKRDLISNNLKDC